jgi:hypothetical protein
MPYSGVLADVLLIHPCPYCGHKLAKKGSWFQAVAGYECQECFELVRLTRHAKSKLLRLAPHRLLLLARTCEGLQPGAEVQHLWLALTLSGVIGFFGLLIVFLA